MLLIKKLGRIQKIRPNDLLYTSYINCRNYFNESRFFSLR